MFVCTQMSIFVFRIHFTPVVVLFISLQCSNQSDPTSANQQVQLLLEEKQQLEAHVHQVCVQQTFSHSISACQS